MKRLIVNADDFGLSPGTSRGIVEAHARGVVTSASMLVNLEHFADGVVQAREYGDLPLGIHLSLLWGPPVAERSRVASLLDRNGEFPRGTVALATRHVAGRLAPAELRTELRAQVLRFLASGLEPTHLDTHKHVHCLPRVLDALIDVAREFGIRRLRLPVETARVPASAPAALRRAIARLLLRRARGRLAASGLRTTDHFLGLGWAGRLNRAAVLSIFERVPSGLTELMCHPGYADDAARRWSRDPAARERELAVLADPTLRAEAEARGVELVSFREL